MGSRTINSGTQTNFAYTGNMMASADGNETFGLSYDENGRLITGYDSTQFTFNWDNKLRSAEKGSTSIGLKYDPMGNRIYKNSSEAGQRKYIVDVVGELPVILMELDSNFNVVKSYVYGNAQVIAMYDGAQETNTDKYFYMHDRLGSVRELIDRIGAVVLMYTYNPFGELLASNEGQAPSNCFKFTGRDPILGKFEEPLTLHKYLYCGNNPLNGIDPQGLWTLYLTGTAMGSFGLSGVRQSGIVIDDNGNVGWINITGVGAGSPAAALGGSIGWTNADTVFDLEGTGLSLGGSIAWGGGEYIVGKQRSGELYHGVEFTFSPVSAPVPAEIHVHVTHTTVYESGMNWRETSGKMEEGLLEAAFQAETLGEAYGLLFIWGLLE